MSSQKILVTGAGGYIGSITSDLLLSWGFDIVVLDNFKTGFKKPLELLQKKYSSDRVVIYQKDLTDNLDQIFTENQIEAVLHFAALIVVGESMREPQKYFSNNVCGTQNLLTTLLKFNIDKFIFSSTAAVYGEVDYVPIDENHKTFPVNPYGQSKRMVEQFLEWYSKLLSLNYVIFRYFNVCGASQDGELGYSTIPPSHLVQAMVRGALNLQPFYLTFSEVDTPDKSPIRDYVNVLDLADAHLRGLNYLLAGGKSQVINLGTGEGNSVLEMVKIAEKVTGHKFDLQKGELRLGEDPKLIASNKKAKEILGWQPKRSIKDSIESLVKWFKAHPNGWEY